ncbi:hypothetical protein SAE02_20470 [Skermanella aerolata]|uniref:Uncharacterized protein n=1 Tax=Skermanella aerolata TaxID=393310 RepID=A0A512DN49_9PROT|nr:hypothetical protein [Skermanella aerolata]KJB94306.1 hypothetical protein N826_11080 [Skermanella aerolata KACC 11604]GEO37899.1 hypothetical protein SAE02_20470 [Skermanella aerolata]
MSQLLAAVAVALVLPMLSSSPALASPVHKVATDAPSVLAQQRGTGPSRGLAPIRPPTVRPPPAPRSLPNLTPQPSYQPPVQPQRPAVRPPPDYRPPTDSGPPGEYRRLPPPGAGQFNRD